MYVTEQNIKQGCQNGELDEIWAPVNSAAALAL
jgi:hypothetical protein